MTLSVTSAPDTLALLQALSSRATAQPTQSSSVDPTSTTSTPSVSSVPASPSKAAQGLSAVGDGLMHALTIADAADAAGQGVMGLLQQMRTAAGQAADPSISDGDRAALDQQFQASAGQIGATLSGATVNGANLVDGSLSSGLKVALGDGTTASLTPVNLTVDGPTLGGSADTSIASKTSAASAYASLGGAIGAASAGLSTLQAQADQISAHAGFLQTLGQALASPTLIPPDQDGGDSVRLMALQVSQQLSTQSTAIANQTPQSILSLFRS